MWRTILSRGIVLLLLSLALIAMALPRGRRLGSLTAAAIEGKWQAGARQTRVLEGVVDALSPRTAGVLADVAFGLSAALALLFVSLLIILPFALYRLDRNVRKLKEEIAAARLEVAAATRAMGDLQPRPNVRPDDKIWTLPVAAESSPQPETALPEN